MDVEIMETTTPNRIPDVFQRLLNCLEEELRPVSWTLSKSSDGCFSLRISEIPAKHERPCKRTLASEVKASESASGQAVSPSGDLDSKPKSTGSRKARKRKSPAQLKRDRQRRATWRLKQQLSRENRQAAAATAKPAPREPVASEDSVSPESPAESETLDFSQAETVSESVGEGTLPLPLDSDPPSAGNTAEPVSATTSELDPGGFETCANCGNIGGPSVKLSSCSRCKAVKYCGVTCQKEQWPVHKSACAILRRMNERLDEL